MTPWQKYQQEKAERAEAEREEERQHAENQAAIADLKKDQAELQRQIDALVGKAENVRGEKFASRREFERMTRDTLTWLPAYNGNDFAQAIVSGNSEVVKHDLREAWESVSDWMEMCRRYGMINFYLDQDHDFSSRLFEVDRLYFVPGQGIYCDGCWTREGLELKRFFIGVSPAWLPHSKKFPPPPTWMAAKAREAEETKDKLEPDETMACLGAVCITTKPTFAYYNQWDLEGIKAARLSSEEPNNNNTTITNQ